MSEFDKRDESVTNPENKISNKFNPRRVAKGKSKYGYSEQKKPLNLTLTPTAIDLLTKAADSRSLSKSELVEQWIRNILSLDTGETD